MLDRPYASAIERRILPEAPAICNKAVKARTDGDGRYEFEVKGEDTQGTLGNASTMNVVFSAGRGKTSTAVSFVADGEHVSLPDARLWNPKPQVRDSDDIRLSWSPLRGSGKVSYSALLYDASGSSAIWSQKASGDSATLDTRILEDRRGTAAVGATAKLDGADGADDVRANYLSARLPVRGTAGRPLSRGKACAPVSDVGPVTTGCFGRCGVTDGKLDAPAQLGKGGVPVTGAVVDLGSRRPIDLVVARGFSGQLLLEVSDDNHNYRLVATGSGTAVALEPNVATTARYVRLRSPSGLDLSLGYEISVW